MTAEKWFRDLLAPAGIVPNGPNSYDPQIHNPEVYNLCRWNGSVGLGDSYVNGLWDCEAIDEMVYRIFKSNALSRLGWSLPLITGYIKSWLLNQQSFRRAFRVADRHYDLGNDLFEAMLGGTMAYSCGYWKPYVGLAYAQDAKFSLICKKLGLKPGMRVLDIGCGWGGLAKFMAACYEVEVVGLTNSQEQLSYARANVKDFSVDIRLQDYRTFVPEKFDRVVSVGMFEHVGPKNYPVFMDMVHKCLDDDGLFLLHTIGNPVTYAVTEPWIERNIFPGGVLPSLQQICKSAESKFVIEDVHNFGSDYDHTLMAWHENFVKAWPELQYKYGESFYRMWTLYLLGCAGAFRARTIELWQIMLSPNGVEGGYDSVR